MTKIGIIINSVLYFMKKIGSGWKLIRIDGYLVDGEYSNEDIIEFTPEGGNIIVGLGYDEDDPIE